MISAHTVLLGVFFPVGVCCVLGNVWSGGALHLNHVAEWGGLVHVADELGDSDVSLEIPVDHEVVRVDDWVFGWVCGVDMHVTPREGEEGPVLGDQHRAVSRDEQDLDHRDCI